MNYNTHLSQFSGGTRLQNTSDRLRRLQKMSKTKHQGDNGVSLRYLSRIDKATLETFGGTTV